MRHHRGFSFLELMIAVVIVAVLAAVAYPAYTSYVGRGYRAEAHTALDRLANLQEQYFMDQRQYANSLVALGESANPALTKGGHYQIATASSTAGFTLTATAQGAQASRDSDCQTMTLSADGVRSPATCW